MTVLLTNPFKMGLEQEGNTEDGRTPARCCFSKMPKLWKVAREILRHAGMLQLSIAGEIIFPDGRQPGVSVCALMSR